MISNGEYGESSESIDSEATEKHGWDSQRDSKHPDGRAMSTRHRILSESAKERKLSAMSC